MDGVIDGKQAGGEEQEVERKRSKRGSERGRMRRLCVSGGIKRSMVKCKKEGKGE